MGDSGDAVMARWLQSAGLQHLAASSGAAAAPSGPGGEYRGGVAGLGGAAGGSMLPSLLMQVRFLLPGIEMLDLVPGLWIAKVAF